MTHEPTIPDDAGRAELERLFREFAEADAAYTNHGPSTARDVAERVAFDLEERRLMKACTKARLAYQDALDAHVALEAAPSEAVLQAELADALGAGGT